jgi:hypothetical protein
MRSDMSKGNANRLYRRSAFLIKTMTYFALAVGFMTLYSCSPTRRLADDQFLLVKNEIQTEDKHFSTDELYSFLKQKENRKILGLLRFHLAIYNLGANGKDRKLNRWLTNTVGEKPTVLDTNLTHATSRQMQKFLYNKGYFNGSIHDTVIYKGRKKAINRFTVNPGIPYTIRNYSMNAEDHTIDILLRSDPYNYLVNPGDIYDMDKLQAERERITAKLKNNGYYFFSREYIYFKVDTNLNSNQLDISLSVKNPTLSDGTAAPLHDKCYVRQIIIKPDFYGSRSDSSESVSYLYNGYTMNHAKNYHAKPGILAQSVYFKPGDLFQFRQVDNTYKRLAEFNSFKFINIGFSNAEHDSIATVSGQRWLDCKIELTPHARQFYTVELQGTNSSGDYGVEGYLIYGHRNLLRGYEQFHFRLKGAMELAMTQKDDEDILTQRLLNTYEYGAEASMRIPRFFLPLRQDKVSKNTSPKTQLKTAYNHQVRPDYNRTIINFGLAYEWKESRQKTHIIYPADLNMVSIIRDSAFTARLYALNNPLIFNSYRDHLTAATKYTYIYNSQDINKATNFMFLRFNFEIAGNMLRGVSQLFERDTNSRGEYELFKIAFAQYVRSDFDLRYNLIVNPHNRIVFRLAPGIGYAYGNSTSLPFEKSFYAGGANGIRAWKMQSLGPGSFRDSIDVSFFKRADMAIETNIEYRFDVISFFKGALFVDAGNIWLVRPSEAQPGGNFTGHDFLNQTAVGGGMGFRFDFSFVILRIDVAIPLRDPTYPEGERWLFNNIWEKRFFKRGIPPITTLTLVLVTLSDELAE